jgi:hypothetical protein
LAFRYHVLEKARAASPKNKNLRLERQMNAGRPLSIAILFAGAVLVGVAYYFSTTPLDRLSSTSTAQYGENTMRYIGALFGRQM